MRHYFSYEEDEAYKEGKRDEEYHRSDYNHNKYAYDGEDRAYWDGREEEAKEEKRREEEREDEERQEREEERRNHERRERAEREQEQEEDYQRQRYEDDMREIEMEQRREEQQFENDCATEEYLNESDDEYNRVMTEITETPSTEEELFNEILNNERGNQILDDERRNKETESWFCKKHEPEIIENTDTEVSLNVDSTSKKPDDIKLSRYEEAILIVLYEAHPIPIHRAEIMKKINEKGLLKMSKEDFEKHKETVKSIKKN